MKIHSFVWFLGLVLAASSAHAYSDSAKLQQFDAFMAPLLKTHSLKGDPGCDRIMISADRDTTIGSLMQYKADFGQGCSDVCSAFLSNPVDTDGMKQDSDNEYEISWTEGSDGGFWDFGNSRKESVDIQKNPDGSLRFISVTSATGWFRQNRYSISCHQ